MFSMNRLTREKIRGKKLENHCKSAYTTPIGNKTYCYGLYQNNIKGTSEEIAECCKKCKAYIDYEWTRGKDKSE